MLVVAVIGLLAAIAVPNFVELQYRAKRSEVAPNVQGIKASQAAYEAAWDEYLAVPVAPTSLPGKQPIPWSGNSEFQALGWAPNGSVRGQYGVTTNAVDFVVTGEIDADGDTVPAVFTATRNIGAVRNTGLDVY